MERQVPGRPVSVRPAVEADRSWIVQLLVERWGSTRVVSRGRLHAPDLLPALVATGTQGERLGLVTYRLEGDQLEVVTLDASVPQCGIGSALLESAVSLARSEGCRRLWLVTSNDNLDAVRFYQRRGLRLVAVHPGAIARARQTKPQGPGVGHFGIEVHDEVELAIELGWARGNR